MNAKVNAKSIGLATLGVILIAIINTLFIDRYLSRYVHSAGAFAAVYFILISVIYGFWQKKKIIIPKYLVITFTVLLIICSLLAFIFLPVSHLRVDRWSTITSFWDAFFHGQYPYSTSSHLGCYSDAFPVYFLLALPFYLIHEIGFMPLLAVILFLAYLMYKGNKENQDYSFAAILLLLSPFIYWEISTRSTVFFNAFICMIFLDWNGIRDKKKVILAGVFGGLILSTRLIIAAPLALWAAYYFKSEKTKILFLSGIAGMVFILTILPFLLIFPSEFWKHNPFDVGLNTFMPFGFSFLFIGIAIFLGLLSRNKRDVTFYSGICLFCIALIYTIYHESIYGLDLFTINTRTDISCFIFSIPFLLSAVRQDASNGLPEKTEIKNKIAIICPFYNPGIFLDKCVDSLISQQYENFNIIFIDDYSFDGSFEKLPKNDSRVTVIRNEVRKSALENIHNAIMNISDADTIVVLVDGDDWLLNKNVLSHINNFYNKYGCWFSYGQAKWTDGSKGRATPFERKDFENLRTYSLFRVSHIRTFRAGLYHKIKEQDPGFSCLKDVNGNFYKMAYDVAIVLPMLEMAGFDKVKYNSTPLYMYNRHNPLSDEIIDANNQISIHLEINQKMKFKQIDNYK